MTDNGKSEAAGLQAMYAKIARIAAKTNRPYGDTQSIIDPSAIALNGAEGGNANNSNVVSLNQVIARRR
jgi:hypothetical protein